MNLNNWLQYIQQQHPKNMDLSLERVRLVAERMQLLPWSIFTIIVAGTNGKGSNVRFLESILAAEKKIVGTYSSPHLIHFNERIRINNQNIDDEILCQAFEITAVNCGDYTLTEFEFSTLAALWIFKQKNCQCVILEVGMGGRYDAVNIVNADIVVITNVALDHQTYLGETREKIGYEKAGILRRNCWAIYGENDMPLSMQKEIAELNVHAYQYPLDFSYQTQINDWQWQSKNLLLTHLPKPNLAIHNAATAMMTIEIINQNYFSISHNAIISGLTSAYLPGRFQILNYENCNIILDVAHNPAGILFLLERLCENNFITKKIHAVFSMLNDKDLLSCLRILKPYICSWHIAALKNTRAYTLEQLTQGFNNAGIAKFISYQNIHAAFNAAVNNAAQDDVVLVLGSFYVVGDVLSMISYGSSNSTW